MGEGADLALDRAILTAEDDRLGHGRLARELVRSVQVLQAEGIVVGVQGPWGSGKSSLLNLVEETAKTLPKPPTVVRFNPWWFSGREDLYQRFFGTLIAGLSSPDDGQRQNRLAESLERFSHAVKPLKYVPGAKELTELISDVAGAAGKALKTDVKPPSLEEGRKAARGVLGELAQPIWVFIDDMDRLEAAEMLQMFALVRSLADFPWVSYFVAFDPAQVSEQIAKEGYSDPQNYLEKILDLSLSIPRPNPLTLGAMFAEGLLEVFGTVAESQEEQWVGFYLRHQGLVPTVRRIKRLMQALKVANSLYGGEVHPDDLIGMEVLRAAAPEIHRDLPTREVLLTSRFPSGTGLNDAEEWARQRGEVIASWLGRRQSAEAELRSLLEVLFPVLGESRPNPLQARSERRISDPITFALYYQLGEREIPTAKIAALVEACVASPEPLINLLREQAESPIPFAQTSGYLRELTYVVAARDQADRLEPSLALNVVAAVASAADGWLEDMGTVVGDFTVRFGSLKAQISAQGITLVNLCMGGFELIRKKDVDKVEPFLRTLEQSQSPIWSHMYLSGLADELARKEPLDPAQKSLFDVTLTRVRETAERLEEPAHTALRVRLAAGKGWPEGGYFLPLLKAWNLRGDPRYGRFFADLSLQESLPLLSHLAAMAKERTWVGLGDLRPILNQAVIGAWIERLEREGATIPGETKSAFEQFFGRFQAPDRMEMATGESDQSDIVP